MLLTALRTPFALIDSVRLQANIAAMADRARAAGVQTEVPRAITRSLPRRVPY